MKTNKCLIFCCIAIITVLFEFFVGRFIYFRDFCSFDFPLKYFLKEQICALRFPFLNPYINLDTPYFANPQSGVLYPLSLLLYFLPLISGLKIYILCHYFIIAGGMYYLVRKGFGFIAPVAAYAGIIIAINGFSLSAVESLTILSTIAWFPMVVAFIQKGVKETTMYNWLIIAVLFACQFLGGKPDYTVMSMVIGFVFMVYISFVLGKNIKKITNLFIFSIVLFALICLVQIVGLIDFLSYSSRGMGTFEQISSGSMHPFELIKFFIPDFYGNYQYNISSFWFGQNYFGSFYMGISPFIFLFFSLTGDKITRKVAYFFMTLLTVSLLLSFGSYTPIYHFVYKWFVPLRFMQYPVKFLYFSIFSIVILSSIGFQNCTALLCRGAKNTDGGIVKKLDNAAIVLMVILAALFIFNAKIKILLSERLLINQSFIESVFDANLKKYFELCAFYWIFVLIIKLLLREGNSIRHFPWFVLVFSTVNILCYNMNVNLNAEDSFLTKKPIIAEELFGMAKNYRVYFYDNPKTSIFDFKTYNWEKPSWEIYYTVHRQLMYPDTNCVFGFESPDALSVIEPLPRARDYMDLDNNNLTSLMSVKYIYSVSELANPAYELIKKIGCADLKYPVCIYRNAKVLPKAFVTADYEIADNSEILAKLKDKTFNPVKKILLNKSGTAFQNIHSGRGQNPEYKIISADFESSKTSFLVWTKDEALLFISRRFQRGWKCVLNGKSNPIYNADFFFQAVPIKGGLNHVELTYMPDYFIPCGTISLVVFSLICGYFAVKRKAK